MPVSLGRSKVTCRRCNWKCVVFIPGDAIPCGAIPQRCPCCGGEQITLEKFSSILDMPVLLSDALKRLFD